MTVGLVGRKLGMTRLFEKDGTSVPVSVIEVQPNRVTQVKNLETDGYHAIQVTMGQKRTTRLNKPMKGHFAKAGIQAGDGLWEFSCTCEEHFEVSNELKVDKFKVGQLVDVSGVSKGKGFAGTIKRHHFASQGASHGVSLAHRAPGSIGQNQTPGHVFKGKKMAGQLGNKKRTIQNLLIMKIDLDRNLLLIKGAIPGAPGRNVIIKPAIKDGSEDNAHAD